MLVNNTNWTHKMKILITGADGFIGRNLSLFLLEAGYNDLIEITRNSTEDELISGLCSADFIYHLAGINRPKDDNEFVTGNDDFTKRIVNILFENNKITPIMFSSSIQAGFDNAYGKSKAAAEKHIEKYASISGAKHYIYRYHNIFGKWCKPNYNSFVSTFCYNIARDMDISINNPQASVNLIYIDDVCSDAVNLLSENTDSGYKQIKPVYTKTVGEVADLIIRFKKSRTTLLIDEVGSGFVRALYSTWLSYLPADQFAYKVPSYADHRGVFCEMLKTHTSGQFSFFTAHPGVTRGGHYHHTKNEKFLVINGKALFRFENIVTKERYELIISSDEFQVAETAPGWSHDITNVGDDVLIVMLWANEIFDREKPDTIARPL